MLDRRVIQSDTLDDSEVHKIGKFSCDMNIN